MTGFLRKSIFFTVFIWHFHADRVVRRNRRKFRHSRGCAE